MQRSVFKAKSGGKKYLTVAGHSTCSGPTAEPVKKQVPASFSLTTNPNTNVVTHSNPITLTVTIFDKNRKRILPENCNVTINFIAGDPQGHEGEGFAQLKDGGTEGINLSSVPYSDAYYGLVSYVADMNSYLGIFPLRITLSARVVLNGSLSSKSTIVTLMGDNTIGKYFPQDDPAWVSTKYDHSTVDSIGNAGCLLIDFAMALTAFGINVDPNSLNSWMNQNPKRWNGEQVMWADLSNYTGSTLYVMDEKYGLGIKSNILPPVVSDFTQMDATLANRFPVFAEVYDADNNSTHWILITGKTSTGDYTILDPGSRERVTLGSSYKTIYEYTSDGPSNSPSIRL